MNRAGVSLLEVLIAFLLLLIAVLTLVGYTSMIHRAASESKHQALATMEARSMLERIRDDRDTFELAEDPDGLAETTFERLLTGEAEDIDNEEGHQAATQYDLVGKVTQISGDYYSVVVTVTWAEQGRIRQAVLESRMRRPGS